MLICPYWSIVVLPLAREWIEICSPCLRHFALFVLPLAREWIEISDAGANNIQRLLFSLLRGSGLKFCDYIEENMDNVFSLLRGSGLKCCSAFRSYDKAGSPSYEGVD